MNANEPVAYVDKIWIERPDLVMSQQLDIGRLFMRSGKEIKNYIPLYTHPVKEHDLGISHAIGFDDGFKAGMQRAVEMNVVKELTDEEIEIEWFKVFKPETGIGKNLTNGVYKFALAILRKAQEK